MMLFSCVKEEEHAALAPVPGGRFVVGGLPDPSGRHPLGKVPVSPFFLEVKEVTNRQYGRCVAAGKCPDRREHTPRPFLWSELPVVMVTRRDAAAYCAFVGRRLPTEWEWERAARGISGSRYPYGDEFVPDFANTAYAEPAKFMGRRHRFTAPPGAFPKDRSDFGILDMGGNVAEWTSSTSGAGEPVVRGGHWYAEKAQSTGFHREFVPTEDLMSATIGFRCAK